MYHLQKWKIKWPRYHVRIVILILADCFVCQWRVANSNLIQQWVLLRIRDDVTCVGDSKFKLGIFPFLT